ncbi:MAG: hypothetical protein HY508_00220 [Acidobacteria bacterium]|nr:hypothetical protein [Acidobacteriota bacterium]
MRTGHRYKSYTGETGVSYQYYFDALRPVVRPEGQGAGADYTFVVTADQHPPFTLRVFIAVRALEEWAHRHGRELGPNEQYAAAKMRLFRAFDEREQLLEARLDLVVDERNIEELLAPLGVD